MPRQITARPGGGPARRGAAGLAPTRDATTHGQWVANVTKVIEVLARIGRWQEEMAGNLTAANASESQIRDVKEWSDRVTRVRLYILQWLLRIDSNLQPLINAIEQAGGVKEVADAGYHADY